MRAEIGELQPTRRTEHLLNKKVVLLLHGTREGGRSLAEFLAKAGSDIALVYCRDRAHKAYEVKQSIEDLGQRCLIIREHKDDAQFSRKVVRETLNTLGRLDIFIDCSTGSIKDFAKVAGPTAGSASEEQEKKVETGLSALDEKKTNVQTNLRT